MSRSLSIALLTVAAGCALSGCQSPGIPATQPVPLLCDGHTNAAAALQKRLDAGGKVVLPQGICAIGETLYIRQSDTRLVGQGGGFAGDGPFQPASGLLWTGPAGGTLLVIGATSQTVQGGGITNVGFLSNSGRAAIGIEIRGVEGAAFTQIAADAFSVAAIDFGRTQLNNMQNLFRNYSLDNEINGGAGIRLGTRHVNTAYYNDFQDGFIAIKYGVGIEFRESDGNYFSDTHEFEDPHGTGIGVLFGCNSTSNHMIWLSAGYAGKNRKAVLVYGQKQCGYPHQSWANSIQLYDQNDNGGPPPIVGENTDFWCRNDAGKPCGSTKF